MTKEEFFQHIMSQGVISTLRILAGQSPEGELQMKRFEGLSKDLKLGLVTLTNAAITRNHIAMGLLSLLEDDGRHEYREEEAHTKLSEILRDYLNISEAEESASKALAQEEYEAITLNRKKHFQELPEPDLSPVPKSSLAPLGDIRKMIASAQMELALRHTLTLVQGTDFSEKAEALTEQYKKHFKYEKQHLISYEESAIERIRIGEALIQLLQLFEQTHGQKDNSFWSGIRKWFQ